MACDNEAIKGLLQEIKAELANIDLSQYVKKSELVSEISQRKEGVVQAIVPANSWPPILVDLEGNIFEG